MKRFSGVLLSVTSLPSKYGIGCFDKAAYDFVDWLEKALPPIPAPLTPPTRPTQPSPATPTSSAWMR